MQLKIQFEWLEVEGASEFFPTLKRVTYLPSRLTQLFLVINEFLDFF